MIYMTFPGLPPSVNAAYLEQVVKKGKRLVPIRTLTTEGKAYKRELATAIVRDYSTVLVSIKPNMALGLSIRLSFPNLLNKGWPTAAGTKYKRIDASNRIKLLEDALVEGLGVDDSQFLSVSISKKVGEEATEIWVWPVEDLV